MRERRAYDRLDTALEALVSYAKYPGPDPSEKRASVARSIARRDMASHDSKVREKGQVTIPSAVRDDFGLQVGDTITFYIVDNEIRIRRPRDIARSTAGVLKQYTNGKPILTPEEIDRVASEAIAESGIHTLREIEENYDNS